VKKKEKEERKRETAKSKQEMGRISCSMYVGLGRNETVKEKVPS